MVHYYKQKRYIHACMQAGLGRLSVHDREQLVLVRDYVKHHESALWYVHALDSGGAEIARILSSHAQVSFTPEMQNIFELLIEQLVHDRTLPLLLPLLQSLVSIIDKEQGIIRAKLFVSHTLSVEHVRVIGDYFSWLLEGQIVPQIIIEPQLIVGIRFETAHFLWEDSVRQRLRAFRASIQG